MQLSIVHFEHVLLKLPGQCHGFPLVYDTLTSYLKSFPPNHQEKMAASNNGGAVISFIQTMIKYMRGHHGSYTNTQHS